jgi:hypothetical protein
MMKQQSRRATLLTLLAAFYLPPTLVTGIFGMNIKEFDVQKPSLTLCFEALFAVIAVTAVSMASIDTFRLSFSGPTTNRLLHATSLPVSVGAITSCRFLFA